MDSLSILIPVYNWDCSQLIKDLQYQGLVLGIPYEIIVADDCSTDSELREKSRIAVETHENCRYFGLQHNIGRAAIRNFMADQSKYDRLLFLGGEVPMIYTRAQLSGTSGIADTEYHKLSSAYRALCGQAERREEAL